ncbi:hypothetical protein ACFLTK_03710 [Chloroflexota bacterium]
MTTKRWAAVGLGVTLTLGFAALGFAAMSTNPPFLVPDWVPIALFIASGISALVTVVYLLAVRNKEIKLKNTELLAGIKSDLIKIDKYEREAATAMSSQVFPKGTAMRIYKDFVSLHGDAFVFIRNLIDNVVNKRDIDYLLSFFQNNADILDKNDCGLKIELSANKAYNDCHTGLAQKRAELKLKKEKKAIIQKNINRICLLTYGVNSYIIFRSISKTLPKESKQVFSGVFIVMESAETQLRTLFSRMLDDIEIEWKVTVNLNAV